MEEMYGVSSFPVDYSDKAIMSPDNLIFPDDYQSFLMPSSSAAAPPPGCFRDRIPVLGSDELLSAASAIADADGAALEFRRQEEDDSYSVIKARIASHPHYPRLIQAYIDCQKVGAPPEIASLLEAIRQQNDVSKRDVVSTCYGEDPELDEFMETYCHVLLKYKSDLSRPFDEATSFLNQIENQLTNLCTGASVLSLSDDGGAVSSEEDFSITEGGESEAKSEEQELKDRLLRKYGDGIGSLKLEFSKKKKKGKLPKEARQALFQWWTAHYNWPYPTESDKVALVKSTGLDQKQINNWFINQRKRHWKPFENMSAQLSAEDDLTGWFFTDE